MTVGLPLPEPMAPAIGPLGRASARLLEQARPIFLGAILCALVASFILTDRLNINWDEFNFLSMIYEQARGELVATMQALHVWLFAWLPWSGTTEIDEIVTGRLVMAVLMCGIAALTYRIARVFVGSVAALFATLLYVASDAVLLHGTSFRFDPPATLLCLAAVALIVRRSPATNRDAALAGAIMALAAMISVKVAFYLVPIGLILIYPVVADRPHWRRTVVLPIFIFGVAGLACFLALYLAHAAALDVSVQSAAGETNRIGGILNFLANVGSKMFLEDGLIPRWRSLLRSLMSNPHLWLMAIWGVAIVVARLRRTDVSPEARQRAFQLLALAFPVLTPIFYRNAFDYYYVFMLPPAVWLAAIAFEQLCNKVRVRRDLLPHALLVLVFILPILLLVRTFALGLPDRIAPQRAVVAAVHALFPAAVPYIDGYGVIARFPRVGFFHSTWGLSGYRGDRQPVYADVVAATQPPLLLADSPSLFGATSPDIEVIESRQLLPEDAAFLAAHYLQYWGMLFVAGQRFAVPAGGERRDFAIAVTGDYRLEGTGPVRIDGRVFMPGDIVSLSAGPHQFDTEGGAAATEYRLVWAAAQPAPDEAPVDLLTFFAIKPRSE